MQFIPAILAHSEEEFRRKIEHVQPLGLMTQIDVMDGKFVDNTTWALPEKMRKILNDTPFEAHLMVSNPQHLVPFWFDAGAKRVFFHIESLQDDALITELLRAHTADIGIAINPETPLSRILPYLDMVVSVLVMGVTPGWSGQEFQEVALEKIREIKRRNPKSFVSVDGGVKPSNIRSIADAGADAVVIGSALTDAVDPKKALATFASAMR